ncbi:hypothetical protein BZM27_49850 [Paraburkholderia steynii]|uniref:Uncharacterized protein n=1 Tax=Paraburkholderia steynii TaxID=1245441 RepID=A0A4R0WZW0_9BURK|nr:hypothetical protein BZM27_49850 [Paraburkholderia steynii]
MVSRDIETYRRFVVRIRLEQAGQVAFYRFLRGPDERELAPVPPEFKCHADKESASALTFTVAMQPRARVVIDGGWTGILTSHPIKAFQTMSSHQVQKARLRSKITLNT